MVALLKLRFLAFQLVFQQMDWIELFQLSLLSKRTKNCIRASIRKNTFHIGFKMGSSLKIWPGEEYMSRHVEKNSEMIKVCCSTDGKDPEYTIGRYRLGFVKEDIKICLYWRDGFKFFSRSNTFQKVAFEVFKHVIELLNRPMVSVDFDCFIKPKYMIKVLKFIRQHNLPVDTMGCWTEKVTAKTCTYFMNECKNAKNLTMSSEQQLPRGFEYTPPTPQTFRMEWLSISNDRWVNLEDFMECQKIDIHKTDRGPKGARKINTFLKKWAESSSPLNSVTWYCNCYNDFERIVEGLGDGNIEGDEGTKWLDFVRSDGREASITCYVFDDEPEMVLNLLQ